MRRVVIVVCTLGPCLPENDRQFHTILFRPREPFRLRKVPCLCNEKRAKIEFISRGDSQNIPA